MLKSRFYLLQRYHQTHKRELLHAYYNHPEYVDRYKKLKRKWRLKPRMLIKEISPQKGESVLDVGSGPKLLKPYVEQTGATYFSLDVSSAFCPDIVADAESLCEMQSNTYSCIVLSDVLEHLPDPVLVVREALRVAGKVVIMVPNLYHLESLPLLPRNPFDRHLHMRSPIGWRNLVRASGGRVLKAAGFYYIPSICFNPKVKALRKIDSILEDIGIFRTIDRYIVSKGWHESIASVRP